MNSILDFLVALTLPDLVNGIFETCGGFFIALSVRKLHREKVVKGVSWLHVAFFSSWGFWNLFYYPHLDQWASFWGGFLLVAVNCVWLGQIVYWNFVNRHKLAAAVKQGDRFWVPDFSRAEIVMTDDQFGGFDRPSRSGEIKLYRHSDK